MAGVNAPAFGHASFSFGDVGVAESFRDGIAVQLLCAEMNTGVAFAKPDVVTWKT